MQKHITIQYILYLILIIVITTIGKAKKETFAI